MDPEWVNDAGQVLRNEKESADATLGCRVLTQQAWQRRVDWGEGRGAGTALPGCHTECGVKDPRSADLWQ